VTERPELPEPPEIAEVRRLLAEARHTEPMPDDVAARLDDVLTGLAASQQVAADVVPLASRRRRRVAGWLVAAAAVEVGGVAVAPHLHSDGTAAQTTAGSDAAAPQSYNAGATGSDQTPGPATAPRIDDGLVIVRPGHFNADVRAAQRDVLRSLASSASPEAADARCADAPAGADSVAAEYLRRPATLVFQRASGGSQRVELYVCGQSGPVRSTTLPVP